MMGGHVYDDGTGEVPGGIVGPVERVIVIGAGMAGLATANALTNAGVECLVLEARDRLGGRTHTVDFGGLPIDLGGSWIHHPGGNPMTRLADQFGLSRVSGDFRKDVVFYDIDGGDLTGDDQLFLRQALLQFDDSVPGLIAEFGPETDMITACEHFLDRLAPPGRLRGLLRSRVLAWVEADSSGSAEDVSLGYMAPPAPPDYEGDDIGDFVVGGYRMVVDGLAGGVDIRLDSPVRRVSYDETGVRVLFGGDSVETGSHLVITVPLGVLKAGRIGFDPALPETKTSAIGRLGFGRFEKVVLRFERPFWTENGIPHLLPVAESGVPHIRAVFGMDGPFDEAVVTAFVSGSAPGFRDRTDEEASATVVALLEAATGVEAPPVLDMVRTDWEADPWTRGAYTYCPPGSTYHDLDVLAEPVAGRILFAGEATSSARVGYADGALSTGIREAKRLLGVPGVTLGAINSR